MIYASIEKDVKAYVSELHRVNEARSLPFHNISRTNALVKVLKRMGDFYHLDDRSSFIVMMAGWFGNCGYVLGEPGTALVKSVEFASAYLQQAEVSQQDINAIVACIEAGAGVIIPSNLWEELLCDANTYYYGTDRFRTLNKARRKEYALTADEGDIEEDWTSLSIQMLEKHVFYTNYCRSLLEAGKLVNLEKLRERKLKKATEVVESVAVDGQFMMVNELVMPDMPALKTEAVAKIKKIKEKSPVRGTEMMFRTSSTNNVRVSVMADNKAHIMITVNSIIVSVVLGLIVKDLDLVRHLVIPSIILLVVNVVTIIYSVLATRPNIGNGLFSEDQVKDKSINMLYFGSFYNMGFDEYSSAMKQVMTDSDFLYACLIKDLYWQGKVLGRKYKLLRKAYTTFLFGIVAAVISFIIAGFFA